MALHWAWTFDVRGANADYTASGWVVNANASMATARSRQPLVGYGGSDYVASVGPVWSSFYSTIFPQGALTDGWVQVHTYTEDAGFGLNATAFLALYSSAGTKLFQVTPASAGALTALAVYSGEGTMTLRGTTTGTVNKNAWHVIAVRFKPGTTTGEIQVSIDGTVETIVATGNVGATSSWSRVGVIGHNSYGAVQTAHITVWDNAADDAGTVTHWVANLKPVSDVAIGSYTDQGGGSANLYQAVDDAVPSTADYCTTTTAADTIKFGVNTNNISAAWAPTSIDGVVVACMARGELALASAYPVLGKAASADVLGAVQATGANSSLEVNDVFNVQADASAWSVAGINAGQYGMRST